MRWVRKLFSSPAPHQLEASQAQEAGWKSATDSLQAATSKIQRTLTKQELSRDAQFQKLAAQISALSTLAAANAPSEPPGAKGQLLVERQDVFELANALDSLDRMSRLADLDSGLVQGIESVKQRLEGVLRGIGVDRKACWSGPPNGRIYRVVGAQPGADRPPGDVTEMVSSALLQGEELFREGQVLIQPQQESCPTHT